MSVVLSFSPVFGSCSLRCLRYKGRWILTELESPEFNVTCRRIKLTAKVHTRFNQIDKSGIHGKLFGCL